MLTEIIREAWIALRRNYTRSLLTMLGIVWGIATVTLLIAYGSSFRQILVNGFDAFGKGAVVCWPQQTSEQPGGQRAGKKVVLEQADLEMVKETAPMVKHACLETVEWQPISYGDRYANTAIRGVCPEYGDMRKEFPCTDKKAIQMFGRDDFRPVIDALTIGLPVLLTFIGTLTLGIGGIGVMNIMLVSVDERIREIGLRRALGARKRHIKLQFLAETLLIMLLGEPSACFFLMQSLLPWVHCH